MKNWPWQKWLGKITPIAVSLLTGGIWEFAELPAPFWAGVVGGLITVLVQGILSLFPTQPETPSE